MKKIAIIGASYLQLPLIEKAQAMGYETHVFAWKAGDIGEKTADYFYPISIREKEKILERCRTIGINGIISIASDLAMVTVNYVAEALKLTGNSWDSTLISTNKYAMRKAFYENGDPIPSFVKVKDSMGFPDGNIKFPVIVKPTDRSGSRGVTKVYDASGIKDAISRAISESFEKKAIVEEYVQGKEYSVEGLTYKGRHTILAYTEKYTTGEPHYIETGHMEPASLDGTTKKRIADIVCHALSSLKIENGASHSEIKIDEDGDIRIIEIGARMGGDLIGSDLVMLSTGVDYVRAVIDIAMGDAPNLKPVSDDIGSYAVKYILTKADIDYFEKIRRESPERIKKTVGYHPDKLTEFNDSSERNAGVFVYRI